MTPPVHLGSKALKEADDNHTTVLHFEVVQGYHKDTIHEPLIILDVRIQQLDPETLYNKRVSFKSSHVSYSTKFIVQAAHAEHCTRSRTGCMPMHAHSRATGASLRRAMPNTEHKYAWDARSTPPACNECTTQATYNRYTTLTVHAEHCASRRTHTSARKVHHLVRTCRAPYTHIHTYSRRRVHDSGCTCRPPYTHR